MLVWKIPNKPYSQTSLCFSFICPINFVKLCVCVCGCGGQRTTVEFGSLISSCGSQVLNSGQGISLGGKCLYL